MADSNPSTAQPTVQSPITIDDLQRFFERLEQKLQENLTSVRADISGVRDSVQAIAVDIGELKERTHALEATFEKLSDNQTTLSGDIDCLKEDLEELRERYEEELDKLEQFSRRDNLRFFGIPETPGETFQSCAAKVVQCLQQTVPGKTWTEDDLVRVHRVGKKPSFATAAATNSKPRPMIAKFSRWRDKMDVLTKGKVALKAKGVAVAGDLTRRQQATIELHRSKGKRAYYRGNKLVVIQRGNDDNGASNDSSSSHGGNCGRRFSGQLEPRAGDRDRPRDQGNDTASGVTPRAVETPKPPKRRRNLSSPTNGAIPE